jgi:hypothetical protein
VVPGLSRTLGHKGDMMGGAAADKFIPHEVYISFRCLQVVCVYNIIVTVFYPF